MVRALIHVPKQPRRGDVIEIRALIEHPMETGYRAGSDGQLLAHDLIRWFNCSLDSGNGKELVFSAQLCPAIAANPYLAFHLRANKEGTLHFSWEGDHGFRHTETAPLRVV